MNNFNINLAIQKIKSLADFCRCVNCDKVNEKRVRFICGHSICDKCLVIQEICMLCSPPDNSTHIIDRPQSRRIKHTLALLKSFQELFNVDVEKHCRISEQLKLEKDFFPDCIQAPIKYFNKRKSSAVDKENINPSPLPGECISNTITIKNKMENSINYVQQWLDKNEHNTKPKKIPRKPFADLDINSSNNTNKFNVKPKTNKRSKSNTDDVTWKSKKIKKGFSASLRQRAAKCEHQESGIGLDTETIILDDSQSDIVDKDKSALLAVVNADKSDSNFFDDNILLNETANKEEVKVCCQSTSLHKVPFYRKSCLTENCSLCLRESTNKTTQTIHKSMKNITLTIDSKHFVTTINLSEVPPNKSVTKKSVAIQSDDSEDNSDRNQYKVDVQNEANNDKNDCETFLMYNCLNQENIETAGAIKSKCIIIEESDSDSSVAVCEGEELEVEAEVHRSSEPMLVLDYILTPLETEEYVNRKRSFVRGKTPGSSDSSDKENFDPNKRKRLKCNKKSKNMKLSARKM